MRFGLQLPQSGPQSSAAQVLRTAAEAERLGFDSVWVFDHLITPTKITSQYPGTDAGTYEFDPTHPYLEACSVLAALAASTSRITLGARVLVPLYRPPVLLAKQLGTIDAIAGGRLLVGVGAGWMLEEFEALGMPSDRRLARLDEYVGLMRGAWTQGISSFDGEFYRHAEAGFHPQPPRGNIPLLVGGIGDAALRRAARWGDGWAATTPPSPDRDTHDLMPPEVLEERLAVLRRCCEEVGRPIGDLQIVTCGRFSSDPGELRAHADLGVDTCVLVSFAPPDVVVDRATRFVETTGVELAT